jgi:hypothetical protein
VSAVTAIILQREFSGEVRVIYVGVSPQGSKLPSFTITNSFRRPLVYYLEGQLDVNYGGAQQLFAFRYTNYTGHIAARSAETIGVRVDSAQPWRFHVAYNDSWTSSCVAQIRGRLAQLAGGQKWTRLSKWLEPAPPFQARA